MQGWLRRIFRAYVSDSPFAGQPDLPLADFLQAARNQGLLGCLAVQVERHGHPDGAFREACREAYKEEFFKWARYQALLNELETQLDQAQLAAILLKGSALRLTVYRKPGLRPLSDIDLLVRPENLTQLTTILKAMGMLPSADNSRFSDSQGRTVDLHCPELGRVERGCGLFAAQLWADAEPVAGSRVWRVLKPSSFLAHLAVHALKHSHARLIWLLDIALLARESGASMPEHEAAARALRGALFLCQRLAGREPELFPPVLQQRVLLSMLERDQHPLGQLLLAWHQPDWRDKLAFFLEAAALPSYETADSRLSRLARLSWRLMALILGGLRRIKTERVEGYEPDDE